jgi:hypothetical protein
LWLWLDIDTKFRKTNYFRISPIFILFREISEKFATDFREISGN